MRPRAPTAGRETCLPQPQSRQSTECLSRQRPDPATFLQGEEEKEEIHKEEEKEVSIIQPIACQEEEEEKFQETQATQVIFQEEKAQFL